MRIILNAIRLLRAFEADGNRHHTDNSRAQDSIHPFLRIPVQHRRQHRDQPEYQGDKQRQLLAFRQNSNQRGIDSFFQEAEGEPVHSQHRPAPCRHEEGEPIPRSDLAIAS